MASPLAMLSALNSADNKDARYRDRQSAALNDEGGIDRTIANFGASLLREDADTNPSKFATKTGAVLAAMPGDEGRQELVRRTQEIYTGLLADPKYASVHPSRVLDVAKRAALYDSPNKDGTAPLIKDIYDHDLKEETRWFGGKPGPAMPGYEQYKAEKLAAPKDGQNVFTRGVSLEGLLETAAFAGGGALAMTAGAPIAAVIGAGALGAMAYTAGKEIINGKRDFSKNQDVIDFFAEWGGHTLDFALGGVGGSAALKAAGTVVAKATTSAGAEVALSTVAKPSARAIAGMAGMEALEWGTGQYGGKVAENFYESTDFAKAREGSWTNLILGQFGAGLAGFAATGGVVRSSANKLVNTLAEGAVAKGEYQSALNSLLMTPKAENIIRTGEAQAQLKKLEGALAESGSDKQKMLYDTLLASGANAGNLKDFTDIAKAGGTSEELVAAFRTKMAPAEFSRDRLGNLAMPNGGLVADVGDVNYNRPIDRSGTLDPVVRREAERKNFADRFGYQTLNDSEAKTVFGDFSEAQTERTIGLVSGTDMSVTQAVTKVANEAKLQTKVAEFEPLYRELSGDAFHTPFDTVAWRDQPFVVKGPKELAPKKSVFSPEEVSQLSAGGFDVESISKGAADHVRSLLTQSKAEQESFLKYVQSTGVKKVDKKTFEGYNAEVVVPREIDAMTKEKPLLADLDLKDPAAMDEYSRQLLESHAKATGPNPTEFSMFEIERERVINALHEKLGGEREAVLDHPAFTEWTRIANRMTEKAVAEMPAETKEIAVSAFADSPNRQFLAGTEAKYAAVTAANADFHQKAMKAAGLLGVGTMAILGVTALDPQDAEAGVVSNIAKALLGKVGKGTEDFAKMAVESGLAGKSYDSTTGIWQRMRTLDVAAMAKKTYGADQKAWVRNTDRWALGSDKLMSGISGDFFYEPLANPSAGIGHAMTVRDFNIKNQLTYLDDALKDVPELVSVRKEISADALPILDKYGHAPGAMEFLQTRRESLLANIEKFQEYVDKGQMTDLFTKKVEALTGRLKTVEDAIEKNMPDFVEYRTQVEELQKKWADKSPSARIALALDDTDDFVKRPWMQDKLSDPEKLAVAKIRAQNAEIADALVGMGEKPMSGPYIKYDIPDAAKEYMTNKKLDELLAGNDYFKSGIPYTKMYSRGRYTEMVMPDIASVQPRYINDIESRIAWGGFWDKKNPDGWLAHSNSALVQTNPGLKNYWDRVKDAQLPRDLTSADVWANRYSAFEATRLLFGAVSAGAKHLFKQIGNIGQLGVTTWASNIGPAARIAIENGIPDVVKQKFGNANSKLVNEAVEALTTQSRHYNAIADMEFGGRELTGFDKWLQAFAHKGGIFINGIEKFDRALTVLSSLDMASKQGMTAEQAVYGVMDSIVKNNFLSGSLNATWMRDPKIRALALFQTTPFKLLERRLVNAGHTWQALTDTFGELKKMTPKEALQQLYDLRNYVTEGEAMFKQNVIAEALFGRKDVFGKSVTTQFMRDMLASSIVATAGSAVDLDLSGHVFHLPFVSTESKQPQLRVSPIVQGGLKTWHDYVADNDFTYTTFFKNWLGRQGAIPTTINKAMRISDGDIPDMYRGSWLQYLFSVPSASQKNKFGTR